jgi:hypothetical protein
MKRAVTTDMVPSPSTKPDATVNQIFGCVSSRSGCLQVIENGHYEPMIM